MFGKIWETLGLGVITIVEGIFRSKATQAEAKIKLAGIKVESEATVMVAKAQAMIKLAENAQNHEQAWERILAEGQEKSWKDEYVLLLFSVPLIMAFIPGLAPFVDQGFTTLEQAPDWYLQIVLAGAAVSYGIRKLIDIPFLRRKPKA